MSNGEEIYVAIRKHGDMYRAGEYTVSSAIQQDKSGWTMDEGMLLQLRLEKIKQIVILVRETGDMFLATLEDFRDRKKTKHGNYTARGGDVVRYLPLQYFVAKSGRVKI